MRQVTWASVRVYARRYVATVVAIVVGVGFVVATNALTSAARSGLLADATAQYVGAGTIVTNVPDLRAAEKIVAAAPGQGSVNAELWGRLAVNGRTVTEDARVGTVSLEPSLTWQRLTDGRFPTKAGEGLADARAAEQNGVAIGDEVTAGQGKDAVTVEVVGFARSSTGPLAAPLYLTIDDLRATGPAAYVGDVVVTSADTDAVTAAVPASSSGVLVQTRADRLQEVQQEVTQGVDVIGILLLFFAAIAFFVSALVIANTFSILLAQRSRDFALLRCVGATQRQVRRGVLLEAAVVGVASAAAGVLAGWGLGGLLSVLADAFVPALPMGAVELSALWVVGAWLLGVLVTLGASLVPAVRGTRVSPLAALQPMGAVDVRTGAGKVRVVLAVLLNAAGIAMLAASMVLHNVWVMLAGGMVSFLGVLALGPVLVPALVRLLGLGARGFGVPGRLAAFNAVRNPRRTAATAASLLVGVTLVSGLVTGMATIRDAVGKEMDAQYPIDVTLSATSEPLADDASQRVDGVEGVRAAAALTGVRAGVLRGGKEVNRIPVVAVDDEARRVMRADAPFGRPAADEVHLPWDTFEEAGLSEGQTVVLAVGDERVTLRVRGADGAGSVGLVAPATLARLTDRPTTQAVWARAADGADAADVRSAATSIGWPSKAEVEAPLEQRAFVVLQLDVMTGATIALLGVGLVIALVGIGNTLGLSVLERAREHAVLRALGLTRRQLHGTLAAEALLLALVAGLLGTALGATYAWVAVRAVVGEVISSTAVQLPVGQLVVLVLAAGAAGLVACLLPARRAGRVAPAAGLAAD